MNQLAPLVVVPAAQGVGSVLRLHMRPGIHYRSGEDITQPQKLRDPSRAWVRPNVCGRTRTDDPPGVKQKDPVCNPEGLILIVRDI